MSRFTGWQYRRPAVTLHATIPLFDVPGSRQADEAHMDVEHPPDSQPTLLETCLPVQALSEVVAASRRTRDAAYGAHRWFARRPPALLRGLLLAASLPANTDSADFWSRYRIEAPHLSGHVVFDPFTGGGSTLLEALRLGAAVAGRDIDPVAINLVEHELTPPEPAAFAASRADLLTHLRDTVGHLFPSEGERLPLHTFSIAVVTCPDCAHTGPLYRNPVIARGNGRAGSVTRTAGVTAFCPICLGLCNVSASAKTFNHCGRRHRLDAGTWVGARYICPQCRHRFSHTALRTGAAPRHILAVEETQGPRSPRQFRPPLAEELALPDAAADYLAMHDLPLPRGPVPSDNLDGRPGSHGMPTFADLFTGRQLALFGTATTWLNDADLEPAVRRALRLGVSNALTTNNRLCGYATDYGRLAGLFSVRGYSLPALAVELNALHPTAGRGTLVRTLDRVAASLAPARAKRPPTQSGAAATAPSAASARVVHGAAGDATVSDLPRLPPGRRRLATLVVTDPPYYDYIAYDTLSAFYRAWLPTGGPLAGTPVLPNADDGVTSFGDALGAALTAAVRLLTPDGVLLFTYHSLNPDAWAAAAHALRAADLRVTALWAVLADPHMGHHGTSGACQYDVVVVARPSGASATTPPPATSATAWLDGMGIDLPPADVASCTLAYEWLRPLWSTGTASP